MTTIDARVRAWRSHGSRDGVVGLNYRMTDIQAAVGRVQLGRLPELVAERRRVVSALRERLPGLAFPVEPTWGRSNWQSLCVRLPSGIAAATMVSGLEAQGIAVRPAIGNAHETPEYQERAVVALPESERARRECILLPLPSGMTDDEIECVVGGVQAILR